MRGFLGILFNDPVRVVWRPLVWLYFRWIRMHSNITLGSRLSLAGIPIIDIRDGARLIIGDRVTINSRNVGYHVGMAMRAKLFADKKDAVIEIGSDTRIHGSCIHAYGSIKIGERCLIAANCQIMDSSGHDLTMDAPSERIRTFGRIQPVIIGDDVWLGCNTVVLPGSRIGSGSVIAANSVVRGVIPRGVVAGGNPIRILSDG